MIRNVLEHLASQEYEHDFDKKALDALEGTPGLELLVRKFNQHGLERMFRINYTGSNIRVSEKNYPDIYEVLKEACKIINLSPLPDLYISWSYDINALTTGVEQPIIVLNSGAVDLLSREELLYIVGHEVGHIKSQHVLYHQMAQVLPRLGEIIGSATLGLGTVVTKVVELALLNWQRMSEFTADRAGLLACQNFDVAISSLIKAAGIPKKYYEQINVEAFLQQAQEFKSFDYSTMDKLVKMMSIMWQDHPWTVMRASELKKWMDGGAYDDILNRHGRLAELGVPAVRVHCAKCGAKLKGIELFCPKCGGKIN